MATSGNTILTIYDWCSLKFSWWENSQSIANNTTTIGWKLEFVTGNGSLAVYSKPWEVYIDGTKYSGTAKIEAAKNSTVQIASGTSTVTHNSDGSKTFPYSFKLTINVTLNNGKYMSSYSGSGSGTLDTIARASQPSLVTWPETTNDVGDFGETFSIHMNRASDSFTHTVRYEYGDRTGVIASNVGTGTTWKVPLDFMNDIPNDTSASGRIYVDTYNGSTKIGTKYTGFTVTVPASVKPTCSASLEDITGTDGFYGSPVKGLSKIKVTVNATQAYSSPIASYSITANGVRYSASPATTGFLTTAGTSTVKVTVTDKRGRSGSWSYDMNVQDYSAPAVTALKVKRCDEDGTDNDQGNYVQVTFSAKVSSMSSKNTAVYKLRYKKSTATSYTEKTLSLSNNYSVTDYKYILAADSSSSYDIGIVVQDRHNTITRSTSASTAFTLMNFHPSGTAIRFGGVAEETNTLQNDLVFVQRNNQYCFSSVGAASTDGYILMARITITETNSDTPLTFVFSQRKATAPMTVHVLFKSTADTDPGLSSIVYEGDNYGAFLTKSAESVWDLYVKKVSNSDTVTLNSWQTSYRQMKRCTVEFVGSIVSAVPTGLLGYYRATPLVSQSIIDCVMPVGFVLTLYSHADPNDMYPGTTWVRITNAFLWAVDGSGTIGTTGGSKTHTLTVNELPVHSHGSVYSQNATGTKSQAWYSTSGDKLAYGVVETGGGAAHNNMPPYIQVSMWRRTE